MAFRRWLQRLAASGIGLVLVACASPDPSVVALDDCPNGAPSAAEATAILADVGTAMVTTNLGTFRIELYPDAAPIATANFVALARCGFYDQVSFHRVITGFVIQAGDPQTRTDHSDFDEIGRGGPGYTFLVEPPADGYSYERYMVVMANSGGTDTNGSQFFIDLENLNARLERLYTIFGKVVEGTEVVDAIGAVTTTGPDRWVPIEPVIIESVSVESAS
jgi:cyclophilin family peptidyl-prolyl cis-trans isomerase